MKQYFIRLFNYDKYANQLLLQSIFAGYKPAQAVRLMAHLLAAQQIWLKRCQGLPSSTSELWSGGQSDDLKSMIDDYHMQWLNYISGLKEEDFESIITYQNSKGEMFSNQLQDILGHVINHGTHHRAQIGQQLIADGLEKLPVTDYILYVREL